MVTTGSLLPVSWVVEYKLAPLSEVPPGVIDRPSSEADAAENRREKHVGGWIRATIMDFWFHFPDCTLAENLSIICFI